MRTTTLAITLLFSVGSAAEAQELLTNGDFTQDLSGWELPSTTDASITWQLDGNPTGSLRIESSWAGPPPNTPINIFDVQSPCFEILEGNYLVGGDVRSEVGTISDGCHVDLIVWATPDCTGPSLARTFEEGPKEGTWERLEYPIQLSGVGSSFRLALSLWKYPFPTTTTCSFDNVVLRGPNPFPHEIPVLGPTALVFLALGLSIAALAFLRARA